MSFMKQMNTIRIQRCGEYIISIFLYHVIIEIICSHVFNEITFLNFLHEIHVTYALKEMQVPLDTDTKGIARVEWLCCRVEEVFYS